MKLSSVLLLTLVLSSNQVLAQASSGRSGEEGRRGESKTITASGPISIDLSGENGGYGGTGSDGSSGRCDSYTDEEGNTHRNDSSGDDGGRGGNGGDGGDGGNLTVLFRDIPALNNILFISRGGQGNSGGRGGRGGQGCPNGSDGSSGSSGDDGIRGMLYLVEKAFFPHLPDTSFQQNKISELMKGRTIVKNIWKSVDGRALLASGSEFSLALMLENYEYGSAQVTLKDSSKIDPRFLASWFYVAMSNGVTEIQPNSNFMMVAKHSPDSPNASLEIERLYSAQEFNSIGFETVYMKDSSRFIHLTTDQDLLPRPTLTMNLKVEVKGRFFKYYEVFDDEVPASMIETLKGGYAIDLDQLPLKSKIPQDGKIRLSMNYKLQEMDLSSSNEEVWVVKLKNVGPAEITKEN